MENNTTLANKVHQFCTSNVGKTINGWKIEPKYIWPKQSDTVDWFEICQDYSTHITLPLDYEMSPLYVDHLKFIAKELGIPQ